MFAHAVLVGNMRYETEGESAILVTISEDLNIVVTASPVESANYVDVPLKNIENLLLDQIFSTQSQTPTYGLVITLGKESEARYYLNAACHDDQTIALAFISENDAKTVRRILQHRTTAGRKPLPASQSQGIDVSDRLSDQLTGPVTPNNSQGLRGPATPAKSFVARSRPNGTSEGLQPEYGVNTDWLKGSLSMAVEGIEVSEWDEDGAGVLDAATTTGPNPVEAEMRGGGLSNFNTSDTGLQSSPQFETGPLTMQQDECVQLTRNEDDGFDSSYDISPETSKIRQNQSSPAKPPQPAVSLRTLAGASANDITGTATTKVPATKLSERLRNTNGEVEVDVEKASALSETSTANLKSIKGKAKVPAKATGRVQNASKHAKKAMVSKGKEKALVDQQGSGHDRSKVTKASSEWASKARGRDPNNVSEERLEQSSSALANNPAKPTKPKKKATAEDGSIWDVGLVPSDAESEERSRQKLTAKAAKKQPAQSKKAGRGNKAQGQPRKSRSQPKKAPAQSKKPQTQMSAKRPPQQKAAPTAMSRPKLPREAASKANKKIQGVDESDGIVDDDTEPTAEPNKKSKAVEAKHPRPSRPAKDPKVQLKTKGDNNSTLPHIEPQDRPEANETPIKEPLQSVLPSSNAQPVRRPVPDSYEEASSSEHIDLISKPRHDGDLAITPASKPAQTLAEPVEPQEKESATNKLDLSGDDDATGHNNANDSEQTFIPDSVPNMQVALCEAADGEVVNGTLEDSDDPEPVVMAGQTEDGYFQEALLYTDDGPAYLEDGGTPQDGLKETPPSMEKTEPCVILEGNRKEVEQIDQGTIAVLAKNIKATTQPSKALGHEPKATLTAASRTQESSSIKSKQKEVKAMTQKMTSIPAKAVTSHSATQPSKGRDPFGDKLSVLAARTKDLDEGHRKRIDSPAKPTQYQQTINPTNPFFEIYHPAKAQKNPRSNASEATGIARTEERPPVNKAQKSVRSTIPEKPDDRASVLLETAQLPRKTDFGKYKEPLEEAVEAQKSRQPEFQEISEDAEVLRGPSKASEDGVPTENEVKPSEMVNGIEKKPLPKTQQKHHAVRQQRDAMIIDAPTVSRPAKGGRSQATRDNDAQQHRRDIAPTEASDTVSTRAKHREEDTPLPEVVRKAPMISFSASGPRNQGAVSIGKSKPPKLTAAMRDNDIEEIVIHESSAPKRKFAPYLDNPAPWEEDQLAKRQKPNVDTPPTRHKHVPQMLAEPSPEIAYAEARRPSSQSMRVMENGSPMPFVHFRNDRNAAPVIHTEDDEFENAFEQARVDDDDDQFIVKEDWDEPTISLPQNIAISEGIALRYRNISSNRKQQPSSPHAPSTFAELPPHHVYHNGAIVNAQTMVPLVPTELQGNPFVGTSQNPPGPFMEALRKSSDMEAQRQIDQASKQKTTTVLKKRSNAYTEDPDKTLVEVAPPPKKRKILRPISSNSSNSGPSTSEDESPSSGPSSQESDGETTAHWRKAYEPHQSNMIELLSHIIHVSIYSMYLCRRMALISNIASSKTLN